jgi:hypothetical protein
MRFALLIATLALIFLAGEVLLRIWLPIGAIVYRLDEQHLHEYIPGSRRLFIHSASNGGSWVQVRINEQGFRGAAIGEKGDRQRVVVFGDSFIAAEFSPLEETFVVRLGEQLEARLGRPVETINAGVTAYGPDQIARRMPGLLDELQPDVIVLAVTAGNDFGDLMRNKLFELDEAGALRERPHRVADELRASLVPTPQDELGWLRLIRAVRHAMPPRWRGVAGEAEAPIHPVATRLLKRCHRDAKERESPEVSNLFFDQYDADLSMLPNLAASEYKRAMMKGILGHIAEIARRGTVPLLVVAIPSALDVKPDHYGLEAQWDIFVNYRRSGLTDAVTKAAADHYMEVLDLFPVFLRNDPDSLYFAVGNDHWNSAGQALAAEVTAARLVPLLAQ